MTLVQVDINQYMFKDDMIITFAEASKMIGVTTSVVHTAAKTGKLKNTTQVGQSGWGCLRQYNNETTYGDLKEWRAGVRPYNKRKSAVETAIISVHENRKAA
tara:strand:+ start:81 stop:386 length:306 start_codon:yes stop_codon:yes gene_type:complete